MVPACPVQIRAHHHIAVYIDSNKQNLISFFSTPTIWFRKLKTIEKKRRGKKEENKKDTIESTKD